MADYSFRLCTSRRRHDLVSGYCIQNQIDTRTNELYPRFKAMSKTGFWNQLYKIGHAFYLARYLIPFLIACRPAVTEPRVFAFLKDLKKNEAKDLPVGTAGFCWGGPFVTKLCWDQDANKTDDGKRVTVCGYVAHPSNIKYPDDIDKVVLPYSVAASEHDQMMSPEQAKQTETILKAKNAEQNDQGIEHEFFMYLGAHHGFAVSKLERTRGYSPLSTRLFSNKDLARIAFMAIPKALFETLSNPVGPLADLISLNFLGESR